MTLALPMPTLLTPYPEHLALGCQSMSLTLPTPPTVPWVPRILAVVTPLGLRLTCSSYLGSFPLLLPPSSTVTSLLRLGVLQEALISYLQALPAPATSLTGEPMS